MAIYSGSQAKLCIEPGASAHTFNTDSEPYEFLSETMSRTDTVVDTNAIRGTRSHAKETTRVVRKDIAGTITLIPSPADLNLWLPRILGTAESSDSFTLAETLAGTAGIFGVLINRVQQTHEYKDCVVNRATFRGSSGGFVELSLDIIGKDEATGTSFPSLTLGTAANNAPYVFSEGVLTLVSATREFHDFEITIDNVVQSRFADSLVATALVATDRIVTLRATTPYVANDLTNEAAPGTAGGTLVFTNGNMSTTFTFGNLTKNNVSPNISGKGEINMTVEYIARTSSTTKELVVTHDSTT